MGVPQGSVLGPILFNVFINDLFLNVSECSICNFADDNTLYSMNTTLEAVLKSLQSDIPSIINWFNNNGMVANPAKFQMIILGADASNISLNIDNQINVEPSKEVKLLGITFDDKLSFYPHIKGICRQISNKTKALLRIRNFLSQKQISVIFNAYIAPLFNYCPLIWMFCSKQAHDLIISNHRRALCAKTGLFGKSYEEILQASETTSIHSGNLMKLVVEVFKSLQRSNPEFMWNVFKMNSSPYSLRRGKILEVPRVKNNIGLNSFAFRAGMAWNELPARFKEKTDLKDFKSALKSYADQIYCQCKLCSACSETKR